MDHDAATQLVAGYRDYGVTGSSKKALRQPVPPLVNGRYGWIVGAIYGAANITFTLAVFHTATSNLVFILACNAMVAAILSWLLLAERPALATWNDHCHYPRWGFTHCT